MPFKPHPNSGGLVDDTAYVAPTAYVGKYAAVKDKAPFLDDTRSDDFAQVFGDARVSGNAHVHDEKLHWIHHE